MEDVKLKINEDDDSLFYIEKDGHHIAQMFFGLSDDKLTVYHTEVKPAFEGKGYAKELLLAMVAYARANQLKVVPRCPYVHAEFTRHAADYADIWEQPVTR